jgi:hypothetical protein
VEIVRDGEEYGAMRLTAVHSSVKPEGRAVVSLHLRAAEGLDREGFARFRKNFARTPRRFEVDGDVVEAVVQGLGGELRLVADVAKARRLVREGAEPGSGRFLLAVDGFDVGRDLLKDLGPLPEYRRLLTQAEEGGHSAPKAETVVEAEDARLIVPPFRVDEDSGASGGKFIWVPGEEGEGGGSEPARAIWLVHAPTKGLYRLWARVRTPTPSDDSFFVSVRQGGEEILPRVAWHAGVHKDWAWARVAIRRENGESERVNFELAPGAVMIEFRCREDASRLDALFLTQEQERGPSWVVPTGADNSAASSVPRSGP